MKIKWINSLLGGLIFLGILVGPASAALCPGDFLPWISELVEQPRPSYSSTRDYVVKKGDTLWGISREYHIDLNTLWLINNLEEDAVLTVGQTLQLPVGFSTHTIRSGDTLSALASRYQVGVQALIAANRDKDPCQLEVGDILIIPAADAEGIMVSAAPSRGYGAAAALLRWPVIGKITSPYGWRKSGFHHGVDIAEETGTPIRAAADGLVTFTGSKPVYGKTVIIAHNDGRETLYAHAQSILVNQKQSVRKGQIIATVGTTGRTTGPHLHFEVKVNGKNINPMNQLQ